MVVVEGVVKTKLYNVHSSDKITLNIWNISHETSHVFLIGGVMADNHLMAYKYLKVFRPVYVLF